MQYIPINLQNYFSGNINELKQSFKYKINLQKSLIF